MLWAAGNGLTDRLCLVHYGTNILPLPRDLFFTLLHARGPIVADTHACPLAWYTNTPGTQSHHLELGGDM